MDLCVTIEDIQVSPSLTARNLGMVLDDQPSHHNGDQAHHHRANRTLAVSVSYTARRSA